MNARRLILPVAAAAVLCIEAGVSLTIMPVLAQGDDPGQSIYGIKCAACHRTGLLGAPKLGVAGDWTSRTAQGRDILVKHAIEGFKQMPARGGNAALSDTDVASAVDYMLAQVAKQAAAGSSGGGPTGATGAKQAPSPAGAAKAATPAKAVKAVTPESQPLRGKKAKAATPRKVRVKRTSTRGVNAFNRLMKPPSKRNPPPTRDGIHDPGSAGTKALQAPRDAFVGLPKAHSGNRVDWAAALKDKHINPRNDRLDAEAKPVIMDLNIVREVKGSMPDVVYPHEAHTQWLDCSNCHPAIFAPQKGANPISMAGILLGQQCGVCHGKVAFPVSECRRCHSGDKK